jgi:hypothetical protein
MKLTRNGKEVSFDEFNDVSKSEYLQKQAVKLFENVVNGVLNGCPEGKEDIFELGKSIYKKHIMNQAKSISN